MWLLIAVGFVVALPALWLLALGVWPESASRYKMIARQGLLKCFLLGLIPLACSVVLITLLSKIPKIGALAVLVGGVIIAWGFIGASGIASLIGERLWPQQEPWRQTKQGGLVLILCALLPVVGWAVLLPLLAVLGWGIVLRSCFLRAPQVQSEAVKTEMPPA